MRAVHEVRAWLATPISGDVILTSRTNSPTVYILSSHNEPEGLLFSTHDSAVFEARAYAKRARVDVWETHDGGVFTLIARHRTTRGTPG